MLLLPAYDDEQLYCIIHLLKTWDFIKAHSHGHLFDDIELKGVTRNTSSKPGEHMHGPVKGYWDQSNFKDVGGQVCIPLYLSACVHHSPDTLQVSKLHSWDLASDLIHQNVARHDALQAAFAPQDDEELDSEGEYEMLSQDINLTGVWNFCCYCHSG